MPGDSRTNIIGDVFGKDINITQIYGPEAMALEPQSFVRSETVRPFSTEWLLFSQQSVPFVGQVEELGEVRRFLAGC